MVVGMMEPPPYGPLRIKKENIEDLYVRSVDHVAEFYGIDGCPTGWFYVGIDTKGECQFGVLEKYSDIGLFAKRAKLTLVDIPIGLVSSGNTGRLCDSAARKVIKPKGSSVFPAPARAALLEHSYIKGSEANRQAVGRKLSTQSWAIVPKIREVDDYMRSQELQGKVREMHPEVAFWALNDRKPLQYGKKKQEGAEERLGILTRFLPSVRDCYENALNTYKRKDVTADDILDALVGAVTAMHFPGIKTLPENPIKDEEGLAMEMVYALI
jgi:predicted RNase H-like nuclease